MSSVESAFLRSARITRTELYEIENDRQIPINLVRDAHLPFLGFAGPRYKHGGVVLMAINPGGGGDAYMIRTAQDSQLLPLIELFLESDKASIQDRFLVMSENYSAQVKTWNLWRILYPVLQACNRQLEEVAYLNCFPYRTSGDRMPEARAIRNSWSMVVAPLLSELKPSIVIALGRKAGRVVEKYIQSSADVYVVPRTIGDSRISEEAKGVLSLLQRTEA